jgi:hypothetical protein
MFFLKNQILACSTSCDRPQPAAARVDHKQNIKVATFEELSIFWLPIETSCGILIFGQSF